MALTMSKCEANEGSSVFAQFRGGETSRDTALLSGDGRGPDGPRVARTKAEAERGEAGPYVNFAKNDQLGPFMQTLKIEVDGSVRDAAITAPGRPGLLRVVVCTGNGATVFDIPRPRQVTAPRVPQA
jgi:hypothetical protein